MTSSHGAWQQEQDREALAELNHHWDSAYDIGQTGPFTWLAARRDGKGCLHANSADELMAKISADYLDRPVPRDQAPSCGLGCELPAGHEGRHDDLDGNKWDDTPGGAA